jgi:hypothetical protein
MKESDKVPPVYVKIYDMDLEIAYGWCDANLGLYSPPYAFYDFGIVFYNPEDAVAFKLKFGL